MITKIHVITWLELAAAKMQENKTLLTELDSEIGDADHGINMERGFKKVFSQLPSVAGKDIGTILKTTGMALISSVGGASGPLYGTFFLDACKVTQGKEELSGDDLTLLLVNGINGIKRIGKANPGDKTLVDTFEPALKALQNALNEGDSLLQALEKMSAAAKIGHGKYHPHDSPERQGKLSGGALNRAPGSRSNICLLSPGFPRQSGPNTGISTDPNHGFFWVHQKMIHSPKKTSLESRLFVILKNHPGR